MRSFSLITLVLATLSAHVQADLSLAQQIGAQLHPAPYLSEGLSQIAAELHEQQLIADFAATASNPCSTTLTSTITIMKTVILPMPTSSQTAPQSLDMSLDIFIPAITAVSEGTASSSPTASPSPTTLVESASGVSAPTGMLTNVPFLFGLKSAASSRECSGMALSATVLLSTFLLAL